MRASKCVCGQTRRLRAVARVSCTIRMVEPMVTASPGSTATRAPCSRRDVAHLGPVDAADVLDLEQAAFADVQAGVQARRERIGDADVGVVGAPDRQVPVLGQRLRQEQLRPHDQQVEGRRRQLHRRVEQRGQRTHGFQHAAVKSEHRASDVAPDGGRRRQSSVKLSVRQTSCRMIAAGTHHRDCTAAIERKTICVARRLLASRQVVRRDATN